MSRRVIVVGPTPPPFHGVSVMTKVLVESLRRSGLLAAHLDTRDPRPVETLGRFDFENVRLAALHLLRFGRMLIRHRDAAVYVPISQNRLPLLRDASFLLMARMARRRRYVHLHGGYFRAFYEGADPFFRLLTRVALRGTEQGWVLTEGLADQFADLVPAERVRVLENVVEDFDTQAGARPSGDNDAFRLLYLANLIPGKGCFDLMDALRSLGPDVRGIHVRFVGEGTAEVRERLQAEAAPLERLGATVELPGALMGDEKRAAYAWADLFVYPTRYQLEGQPLVIIEAMAAGKAILTTAHRGIPDTVRDQREAVVVAPGDHRALERAIRDLRAQPDLRVRLAASARARYEQRYRPERFDSDLRQLLLERT